MIQAQPKSGPVLYEGARLITGDGSAPIENSAFVVQNGRFTQVGKQGELKVPSGGTRVDLTGKTVMPGMIDSHNHIGFQDYKALAHGCEESMVGKSFCGPENYTRENVIEHLRRAAYFGVVAVHSAGYDYGDTGFRLRDETTAGKIPNAARYSLSGRGCATHDSLKVEAGRLYAFGVDTAAEGKACADEAAKNGVKLVKLWVVGPGGGRFGSKTPMPPEAYKALIDAAHKNGQRVMVHTEPTFMADVIRAGADGLAHPYESNAEVLALMKERGPKFFQMTTLRSGDPDWQENPPPIVVESTPPKLLKAIKDARLAAKAKQDAAKAQASAERTRTNMQNIKATGVTIAFASDAGGVNMLTNMIGWAAHTELDAMSLAGFTPSEIIVAATKNAASVLGLDDLGMVAPNKSADFIVLDANPLDYVKNSRRINKVFIRGTEVDRAGMRSEWAKWWGTQSQ
jgi:imidazolonepropionase-like amidohydrolase